MLNHFAAFAFAFAVAALLTPACRKIASRLECMAPVSAVRSRPVPLLGGIAIVVPVIAGMFVLGGWREHGVLIACAAAVAVVGLRHDLATLKPATKLIVEIVIASGLLLLGYRLHWTGFPTLETLATMFWILGLTNAFNLLDSIDGLCGGVTLIAGAALLMAPLVTEPGPAAFFQTRYIALLLGAVAGFLIYNIEPASVSMGETGNLFIGMSMAVLTVGQQPGKGGEFVLLSVVAVPLLVLLVVPNRLTALAAGSPRRSVAILWALAAAGAVVAVSVSYSNVTEFLHGTGPVVASAVLLVAAAVFTISQKRGEAQSPSIAAVPRRGVAEVLVDVGLIAFAYYLAYRLRFEGDQFLLSFGSFIRSLPVVIAGQVVALWVVGAYRGVRGPFGLDDALIFTKGVLLGTIGMQLTILYLYRYTNYSRTVFIIYAAVLLFLLIASRTSLSFRVIGDFAARQRKFADRVAIYGADARGAMAVREVLTNPWPLYRLMGFIDDDPERQGTTVQGYRVLGNYARLEEMVSGGQIDTVLISAEHVEPGRLAALQDLTVKHRVKLIRLDVSLKKLD